MDNATPWSLYPRKIDRVPTVEEAGWASGTVWTGAENIVPIGIRSPDGPALSESLYRLSYPGPLKNLGTTSKFLAPERWYKKRPRLKSNKIWPLPYKIDMPRRTDDRGFCTPRLVVAVPSSKENRALTPDKRGTAVAQWLRRCAKNRKVTGSIPDGVIGIFH